MYLIDKMWVHIKLQIRKEKKNNKHINVNRL